MNSIRLAVACLALSSLAPQSANAEDHIVAFPSGSTNLISVYKADDLTLAGTIPAPASSYAVEQNLDGSKYYILNRQAARSILVVDSDTLQVQSEIDLGAGSSAQEMTPDGRYLLVAAASLRVVDTTTDELILSIPVGGAPTKIIVDNTSTRAYVLADSGRVLQVIDLRTLEIERTIPMTGASDIALTEDGARLLVALRAGILQIRTRNFEEIETIPANFTLINASLYPVPGVQKVIAQNRGVAPANTSQLFDLDSGDVDDIGNVGLTELDEIVVVDSTRAYAVDKSLSSLVLIDLVAVPFPTVTALAFGAEARDVGLSPNRRFLYVTSVLNASLTKVDLLTTEVTSITTPVASASHEVVFAPSTAQPARMELNGGDDQFFPPGTALPIPFTVLVTDNEGRPLPNVPVLFEDPAGTGIQIDPIQPSRTNSRGIASAFVTIPEDPEEPEEPSEDAPLTAEGAQQVIEEEEDPLDQIIVSATTGGVDPVIFRLTIIRANGLIKVSGDNQVAAENEIFPRPMVLLATDDKGQPLPPGTEIQLAAFFASCDGLSVPVDPDGFAVIQCRGRQFSPFSSSLFEGGSLSATIPEFQQTLGSPLTTATFAFSVARGGTQLGIVDLGGDGQVGSTGTKLPQPISFRMTSNFGSPPKPIAVDISQISGPAVIINPPRVRTFPTFVEDIEITLGPNAGTSVIRVQASSPDLPTLFYTVTSTGGQPTRIDKVGDGQKGKILNQLAQPLRVQVTNESGGLVPFPAVTWRVIQGDATVEVNADATGSNARVFFGETPGQVRVLAAIGDLQATFTVTSEPPDPASISTFSGQNQTLTTGVLSDPLIVRVNELDNTPAAGAIVTFTGPLSVRLHPINGSPPSNPSQAATDLEGLTGVRVELLSVGGGSLGKESFPRVDQLSRTVAITAELGGNLSTSFLLNVVGRTPAFESRAAVNAATFEGGLVPGSIATLFGTGLMEGVIGTEFAGGSTSFGGTQVRIGGIPAPLLTLSATPQEQINLQVPFELSAGQTTTIEVENNGSRSTVGGVPVFFVQPGMFEIPLAAGGTVAAAIHTGNGTVVTPDNPAQNGEAIALFFTGGGPINQPVPTGTLGPQSPLSVITLPTVIGVDNIGSPVLFSGYAPGFLGLYQVNFQVPDEARCGLRSINLKIGDRFSPNSTIAIRCP